MQQSAARLSQHRNSVRMRKGHAVRKGNTSIRAPDSRVYVGNTWSRRQFAPMTVQLERRM